MANKYCVGKTFDHKKFRIRIKAVMKERKVRVPHLANETGYSIQSIYNYLSGANDSKYMPCALANVLNIKL